MSYAKPAPVVNAPEMTALPVSVLANCIKALPNAASPPAGFDDEALVPELFLVLDLEALSVPEEDFFSSSSFLAAAEDRIPGNGNFIYSVP